MQAVFSRKATQDWCASKKVTFRPCILGDFNPQGRSGFILSRQTPRNAKSSSLTQEMSQEPDKLKESLEMTTTHSKFTKATFPLQEVNAALFTHLKVLREHRQFILAPLLRSDGKDNMFVDALGAKVSGDKDLQVPRKSTKFGSAHSQGNKAEPNASKSEVEKTETEKEESSSSAAVGDPHQMNDRVASSTVTIRVRGSKTKAKKVSRT